MNKFDWNKWSAIAEIASAIAIVATLLYLAVQTQHLAEQTQQNNSLLAAQAGYNYYRNRAEFRDELYRDAELAEFHVRAEQGGPLSEVEERRVLAHIERTILAWQWEWGQYADGNLAQGELPIAAFRQTLNGERGIPGSRDVWETFKYQLRPDFVEWMEEVVLQE